jgi:peptidoglycan hydrolase-like protein with peptidoglycan-binding domain
VGPTATRGAAGLAALAAASAALLLLPGLARAATGPQVWAQAGCGGCHTLAAAGSSGNAGPNLDYLRPSSALVYAQVSSGGGGMPSFGGSLSSSDIQALASWVSSVAGGGGPSTPSASAAAPTQTGAPASNLPAATVKRIQRDLARLGYFKHVVTGFFGPVTTAALQAFQLASGLTADGLWGPKTKAALEGALRGAAAPSPSSLSPPAVKTIQTDLMRLGFFGGPVTGFYGPLTTAAVIRFQKAAGLHPDGVWGPLTAAALHRRLG